jgi:hypothetical protein
VWDDESVSLLQQGTSVWTRHEALGAVTASMFVELPATPRAAAAEAVAAGGSKAATGFDLSRFVKMQMLTVKV